MHNIPNVLSLDLGVGDSCFSPLRSDPTSPGSEGSQAEVKKWLGSLLVFPSHSELAQLSMWGWGG